MTTRALFVFEIDDDYLDDLNSYRRPRSWREKVGFYGVRDHDRITAADGFSRRSEAMDYVDHLQSEEAGQ